MTKSNKGPPKGRNKPCIFPFKDDWGKTYEVCKKDGNYFWCVTEMDPNTMKRKAWGHCEDSCPKECKW